MKVGRNQDCTCGSGKKYKKCCGQNETIQKEKSLPVPNIVFTPFIKNKKIVIGMFCIVIVIILFFGWQKDFTIEELKDLSQFTLNLILVIGALGISIFSISINKSTQTEENKYKIITSYIGTIILQTMFAIFGYTLSILFEDTNFWLNMWCMVQLLTNVYMVIHTASAVMAFFDIK